jgi:hypothetical protein
MPHIVCHLSCYGPSDPKLHHSRTSHSNKIRTIPSTQDNTSKMPSSFHARFEPGSELTHRSFSRSHFHGQSQVQSRQEQYREIEIRTSGCDRCNHVYSYAMGTPWCIVNEMVMAHWVVCPESAPYVTISFSCQ